MKYYILSPGEWIQPKRRGYKLACCDCGLTHLMDFRVVRGKIQFRCFRDNRRTALVRRWMRAGKS